MSNKDRELCARKGRCALICITSSDFHSAPIGDVTECCFVTLQKTGLARSRDPSSTRCLPPAPTKCSQELWDTGSVPRAFAPQRPCFPNV